MRIFIVLNTYMYRIKHIYIVLNTYIYRIKHIYIVLNTYIYRIKHKSTGVHVPNVKAWRPADRTLPAHSDEWPCMRDVSMIACCSVLQCVVFR